MATAPFPFLGAFGAAPGPVSVGAAAAANPLCSSGSCVPSCFPSAVWKASHVFISPCHTHIGVKIGSQHWSRSEGEARKKKGRGGERGELI